MSDATFSVVISGDVVDGFDPAQVQRDFAQLFSIEETLARQILAQGKRVIKKDLDEESVNRYLDRLARIGVVAFRRRQPSVAGNETVDESQNDITSTPTRSNSGEQNSTHAAVNAEPETATAAAVGSSNPQRHEATDDDGYDPFYRETSQNESSSIRHRSGTSYALSFHGQGAEYFRIWIVNLLLTIATLGIYSAWAKVRNAQYFHGHTELDGSRFAYLAKPLTILKGRLIAVAVFVIYSLASEFNPMVGAAMALLFVIVLPWIVVRSLRFSRRMTAWRNVRFGFDGTVWEAAKAFVFWPAIGFLCVGPLAWFALIKQPEYLFILLPIGVLIAGILMPVVIYKQMQFVINNTRFGTSRFTLEPCGKAFYLIYVKALLIILIGSALMFGVATVLPVIPPFVMAVAYFYLYVFVAVRTNNLLFNQTEVADAGVSFSSTWRDGSFFRLTLINGVLTLCTLGLYLPWALVRLASYKAEHLELRAEQDLDHFVVAQEQEVSALGEELGEVFDVEFGV
ncbi:YjgN family protein [Motiliproteus sp.]|uniref:YjgN family protein n=1 Tax=Motiliproteus sp. TaxID=1898955 RepID=UPI003BA87DB6